MNEVKTLAVASEPPPAISEPKKPLRKFKVFLRHSPLADPNLVIEGTDRADALRRLQSLYPTTQAHNVTWEDL